MVLLRLPHSIGRRTAVVACAVGTLFGIFGCAVAPPSPDIPQRDASELTKWQVNGRIAVAGVSSGGSGSFVWQQNGAKSQVQMRGPIGIGSLRIELNENSTHVETGDGRVFDAAEAEEELAARLGAAVPAQDLRYWLLGQPAPGAHEWLSSGDTAVLKQQEWRIDYQKFQVAAGVRVPSKLVATSGPVKVRILIDRWRIP